MDRTKALDRAAKLKSQMESEHTLGNQEAAHAFAAAMQRLLLEHELNEAEVEAHRVAGTKPPEEPIIEQPVNLTTLGIDHRSHRNANLETLASFVGRAHLCRILIRTRSNKVWFVGTARHVEVSEYMLAVMWRSLHQLAKTGYKQAKREGLSREALKGYGKAFKYAFICELGVRYDAERRQVVREHDAAVAGASASAAMPSGPSGPSTPNSQALMCLDRAMQRVASYIDSRYGGRKRRARAVNMGYSSHARGQSDGRAAASRIGLRANGVHGGGSAARQIGAGA